MAVAGAVSTLGVPRSLSWGGANGEDSITLAGGRGLTNARSERRGMAGRRCSAKKSAVADVVLATSVTKVRGGTTEVAARDSVSCNGIGAVRGCSNRGIKIRS